MLFHERLKELRLMIGCTQKEMATLLEISTRSYQRYEQGIVEPNIAALLTLAERFNISLDYMLGLTDEMRRIR